MKTRSTFMCGGPSRAPRGGEAGAAYLEFIIAFMPVFVALVGLWQLGRLYVTHLVAEHAAFAGARAAAVMIPARGARGAVDNRLSADKRQAVEAAVWIALAPAYLRGWVTAPVVSFPSAPGAAGGSDQTSFSVPDESSAAKPPTMVNVRVDATFICQLPPVDYVMCQFANGGWGIPVQADASFPYQGARYQYDESKAP